MAETLSLARNIVELDGQKQNRCSLNTCLNHKTLSDSTEIPSQIAIMRQHALPKAYSHQLKKHCENCKTLPREHLIGREGVKMFLLKDPFKVFFSCH